MIRLSRYTKEMRDYIIKNSSKMTVKELKEAFNKEFNQNRTLPAISGQLTCLGLKRKPEGRFFHWTDEMTEFLKDNAKGTSVKKLRKMINERFETNLTRRQIESKKNHEGITGFDRQNYDEGDVREDGGKYYIKINNRWIGYNNHLWTKHHGQVPSGHKVVSVERNKEPNIDDLVLLNDSEYAGVGRLGGFTDNKEHNRSIVELAKLKSKIHNLDIHGGNEEYYKKMESLAIKNKISIPTFRQRITSGWTIERAATQPTRDSK